MMHIWRKTALRHRLASSAEAASSEAASVDRQDSHVALPARNTLFRREVLEFQQHNRQWGRVVPLQRLSTRLMVWSVSATAAGAIAFLFVAQYARKEIAPGYLAPIAGTARVFASQPGTISSVHVHQGDMVEKGQPLLTVLNSQIAASGEDVNASMLNVLENQKLTLTRTVADDVHRMDAERQRLTEQVQEHESVLVQLNSEAAIQQKRIALLASMVETGAQLRTKGLVSNLDQKHRQEVLLDAQQALLKLFQQITTRKGELAEVHSKLEQLPLTLGDRIQTLRNELSATEQRIAEINVRGAYTIRAPIGGRVSLLQASIGASVDPKRLQIQIIPSNSPLQAELFIPVRAIGFVEVGQDVRIQFDAFPYQRFGTYHGRIATVSQTVLLPSDVEAPVTPREPAYAATVTLDRPDIDANGKKIPLQPDMSLRADIILEKRTLAHWILTPIRQLRIEG